MAHVPHICTITVYRNEIHFREETAADRNEGFLWPGMEPVNVGAVHDGRELSTSNS